MGAVQVVSSVRIRLWVYSEDRAVGISWLEAGGERKRKDDSQALFRLSNGRRPPHQLRQGRLCVEQYRGKLRCVCGHTDLGLSFKLLSGDVK